MNTANILSVNYGAYNAIRMLIGVYHAAFLISTGVTISQLAVLQIVFSVTVLILDFPLSVIADRFYRKQVVVSGVFFTILFYPLCIQSPDMLALVFSEIFYAIGICCISGAIEGWVLSALDGRNEKFTLCAHLCERVSSFGSVITGAVGILVVYFYDSYKSGYIVSFFLMFVVFIVFLCVKTNGSGGEKEARDSIIKQAKESIGLITGSYNGTYFLSITCMFTLGIQVIYHFWQPIMLSGESIGSLSKRELITLLMCHIGAFSMQYIANYLMPKIDVRCKLYILVCILCSFLSSIACILLFMLITGNKVVLGVAIFSIIHGMISTIPVGAQNIFISRLNGNYKNIISGALGLVSLSCRVASISVLGVISVLPGNMPVTTYIFISAIACVLCGCLFLMWSFKKEMV